MADKRMFSKTVVCTDFFLTMPATAQLLYYQLGMRADDDGFTAEAQTIVRICNASESDLNTLLARKFIIQFDDGVVAIKHWKLNNYIQKDRYKETTFKEHKESLYIDENGCYSTNPEGHTKVVSGSYTQVSIDKDSKDKIIYNKPTVEEIKEYCEKNKLNVDPEYFYNYYEANGWVQGKDKKPIVNWKACLKNWQKTALEFKEKRQTKKELPAPKWFKDYEEEIKQLDAKKTNSTLNTNEVVEAAKCLFGDNK